LVVRRAGACCCRRFAATRLPAARSFAVLLAGKGIAPKEIRIQSIYTGIIPFVILQLIGLVAVIAYPQLALWLMRASYG
jgi:TRAP-type mannitol/chloroaromatic compound transport system permease large subunit